MPNFIFLKFMLFTTWVCRLPSNWVFFFSTWCWLLLGLRLLLHLLLFSQRHIYGHSFSWCFWLIYSLFYNCFFTVSNRNPGTSYCLQGLPSQFLSSLASTHYFINDIVVVSFLPSSHGVYVKCLLCGMQKWGSLKI